jgi:hypothetical protein
MIKSRHVLNNKLTNYKGMLFTNESMHRLVTNFENRRCKNIDSYGDITIGKYFKRKLDYLNIKF